MMSESRSLQKHFPGQDGRVVRNPFKWNKGSKLASKHQQPAASSEQQAESDVLSNGGSDLVPRTPIFEKVVLYVQYV
jgi:hypothetical protein